MHLESTSMPEPGAKDRGPVYYPSINILIVDDNPANRAAFHSVVHPLGYSVLLAESGKKAVEFASRMRFTLILLDVRMPLLTGAETAIELPKTCLNNDTPILFISAFEETQLEIIRAGITGMADFVFSPVNPEVLTWKIENWVDFSIRQELLRRQAVRIYEAHKVLHGLIESSPIPQDEARNINALLSTAVRTHMHSLSERRSPFA